MITMIIIMQIIIIIIAMIIMIIVIIIIISLFQRVSLDGSFLLTLLLPRFHQ